MRKQLLLIALLCVPAALFSYSGSHFGEYLKVGMSAKSVALRNSDLCTADDASAVYINPANLARTRKLNFVMSYANLYNQDIKYDFVGASFKIRNYGVGSGIVYNAAQNMTGFDASGFAIGSFNSTDLNYFIGMARKMGGWAYFGLSTNILYEKLYAENKFGFGFNLSALMELNEKTEVTFIARNILGPAPKYRNKAVPFTEAGFSVYRRLGTKSNLHFTYIYPEGIKTGIQREFSENLTLMLGYDVNNVSAGLRIKLRRSFVDIAVVDTLNLGYYLFGTIIITI